jgi:hypothetical protein
VPVKDEPLCYLLCTALTVPASWSKKLYLSSIYVLLRGVSYPNHPSQVRRDNLLFACLNLCVDELRFFTDYSMKNRGKYFHTGK